MFLVISMKGKISVFFFPFLLSLFVQAGGKNAIIAADDTTLSYVKARTDIEFEVMTPDPSANYQETYVIDCEKLEPVVAKPHSPDNRAYGNVTVACRPSS